MTPFDFHPKALAAAGTFPMPPPAYRELPPGRLALALLLDLSRTLAVTPQVFCQGGGRNLLAYFPRSCFVCEDLLQEHHELLALLPGQWGAAVFGMHGGGRGGGVGRAFPDQRPGWAPPAAGLPHRPRRRAAAAQAALPRRPPARRLTASPRSFFS